MMWQYLIKTKKSEHLLLLVDEDCVETHHMCRLVLKAAWQCGKRDIPSFITVAATGSDLRVQFLHGALERRIDCWGWAGHLGYLRKLKVGGLKVQTVHPRRAWQDRETRLLAWEQTCRRAELLRTRTPEREPSPPSVPAAENQVTSPCCFLQLDRAEADSMGGCMARARSSGFTALLSGRGVEISRL